MRGLLALDVDGVLTDGTVSLDAAGDERKLLAYRDIDAVFRARREGLAVALITAEDTPVAATIARRLEVEHLVAGRRDKREALRELAGELGIPPGRVCYIGDSTKDTGALELAGLGLAPADAEAAALGAADRVLANRGGRGAVAEGLTLFLEWLESPGGGAEGAGEQDPGPDREVPAAALRELITVLEDFEGDGLGDVIAAARLLKTTLESGGTIYTFGNGGSAADAQHLAAEIMGFFRGSAGIGRAVALTADTALLTALANDAGYGEVFSRQLELLARPGDAVVAITTSGRSENVRRGLETARDRGLGTVLLTGAQAPSGLPADLRIAVPSADTQRIQEVHGLVIHLLCALARGSG